MPDWFPKRLIVTLCSILAIALNRKLGLDLGATEIASIAGAGATFVATQTAHDLKLASLGLGKHGKTAPAP